MRTINYDEKMLTQLHTVFGRMASPLILKLSLDDRPVSADQRIAAENEKITAEDYDLNHFPEIRDKYNVMSVPCPVVDDGRTVTFGKKNVRQLVELLR